MKRMIALIAMLLVTTQAHALQYAEGKVKLLESTYMPATVAFQLSGGTASCPAGKLLSWARSTENNKAVYAMLMSAMASGKKIRVFFNDGDASCVPQYMHLVE
jgi:hypothetical protein